MLHDTLKLQRSTHMSMPAQNLPTQEPSPGDTEVPQLTLLNGSKEPFFDSVDAVAELLPTITAQIAGEIDLQKVYGQGTVVTVTPESRIRYLRRFAGLDESVPVGTLVKDYHDLLRRKSRLRAYEQIIPPHEVADAVAFLNGGDENYQRVQLVNLALLRKEGELEEGERLGMYTLKDIYTLLVYAVDPNTFKSQYRLLVRAAS